MQILGFNKFSSKKDGRKYAKLYVSVPFNANELKNSSAGVKCREYFIANEELVNKISVTHIGKEILPYLEENDFGKLEMLDYTVKQ